MRTFLIFLSLFMLFPVSVRAEDPVYSIADGISAEGTASMQALLEDFSFRDAAASLADGADNHFLHRLWNGIVRFTLGETKSSLSAPLTIAVIAILCSILGNLNSESGTAEIAFFLAYAASVGLAVASVGDAAELARRTAEDMATFTGIAMPSLAAMSACTLSPAAAMPSALLVATQASALLLSRIGIPALYISLSLSIVSGLSARPLLRTLSALIRKCALWIVCGSLSLFGAVISITGYAAGTLGGVAAKGIKYAAASLVPVLGSILTESVDAVSLSVITVKNAVGSAGMLTLLLLTLYPVIKTILQSLMYRLSASIAEAAADKRISSAMTDIADMLSALAGMTAAAGVLSILSVGMLLRMTDMGVMLR